MTGKQTERARRVSRTRVATLAAVQMSSPSPMVAFSVATQPHPRRTRSPSATCPGGRAATTTWCVVRASRPPPRRARRGDLERLGSTPGRRLPGGRDHPAIGVDGVEQLIGPRGQAAITSPGPAPPARRRRPTATPAVHGHEVDAQDPLRRSPRRGGRSARRSRPAPPRHHRSPPRSMRSTVARQRGPFVCDADRRRQRQGSTMNKKNRRPGSCPTRNPAQAVRHDLVACRSSCESTRHPPPDVQQPSDGVDEAVRERCAGRRPRMVGGDSDTECAGSNREPQRRIDHQRLAVDAGGHRAVRSDFEGRRIPLSQSRTACRPAGASNTARPRRPSSIRGRVPDPIRLPSR